MRRGKIWNFKRPSDTNMVVRFENDGRTFSSLWLAEEWLKNHGYKYGSTDIGCYVAAQFGDEYNLPQKLHNFERGDIELVDAVIYSHDFREGYSEVWILKQKS